MPMEWVDIENLVVDYVRQRFTALCQQDAKKFADEFGAAYRPLQNLSQNPDYLDKVTFERTGLSPLSR
jgi:hypothetical protein